jgi:hypothetical protein
MSRLALVALLLVPLTSSSSCKKSTLGDELLASEAADSTDSSQQEGGVMFAASDPIATTMKPGEAPPSAGAIASLVAGNAGQYYQPAGCLTATAMGTTVTYTLNDCTGPHGLVHVTGTITVDYTVDAAGVHAMVSATGLMVNGGTLDISATGVYTVSGTTKTLVVTTMGSGIGPRGHMVTHDGDYTLTWDTATACRDFDGAWSTTVSDRTWMTTVSGFHRCGASCPMSGTVSHTGGISGVTITLTFDGTATAQWTSSRGSSGTINLLCTP